jgi:hypothetical protein
MLRNPASAGRRRTFQLPEVGLWIAAVLMLYPLARWFAALKQRRRVAELPVNG